MRAFDPHPRNLSHAHMSGTDSVSPRPPGLYVERNGEVECVYAPLPHQELFHGATQRNVIMEGGAGSGKSLAIRMDSYMRALSTPGFTALILRRSYPELYLSHLQHVAFDVKRLGLPDTAWHKSESTVRFKHPSTPEGKPQPDSVVVFGYVESDETTARFLSSEWCAIYFDELCTFSLRQFLFLSSRARTTIPGLRPIVRGGTNPIGSGASWVRRFFITKKVKFDEAPSYNPDDFLALHSTVRDNKYVDQKEYLARLQALPSEALRKAMDQGEWVIEGQYFSEWTETRATDDGELRPWHVIHELPLVKGRPLTECSWIKIVRVIDWGYAVNGPGHCTWFACMTDGSALGIQEWSFSQMLPKDVAKGIKSRSRGMKVSFSVGDPQMWKEHSGESIAETFERNGVPMIEADNERIPGWVRVHTLLRDTIDDGFGPRPLLQFYVGENGEGCPVIARTMPEMVVDPRNPEDMLTTGVEDHGPDTVRYFAMSRAAPSKEDRPGVPENLRFVLAYVKGKQAQRRGWSNAVRRSR